MRVCSAMDLVEALIDSVADQEYRLILSRDATLA